MLRFLLLILLYIGKNVNSQSWNASDGILPWEAYLQLGEIERPLGLTLNRSSLAHHHFAIGYLCLNSFMYDIAQEAFDKAINLSPKFVEAYIGKMLGCKQAIWSYTDHDCGLSTYNALISSNATFTTLQDLLVSTVRQWYSNRSSVMTEELAFLSSIANLSNTYPNETDIRVLYGLSLLNVAEQNQFQGQMQPAGMITAREVLESALTKEARHPGALHYLIHAYDVAQVDIANKASDYAVLYGQIVTTLSHAQHMPAHIWMRTGSWSRAMSADGTGIQVSLTLCVTKIMGAVPSVSTLELEPVLTQLNNSNQSLDLLVCDAENRAHSTEWLSYSRLQTGDWSGSLSLLRDLFTAHNRSLLTPPNHYLSFAYRTRARTLVDLFHWLNYTNSSFTSKVQELLAVNEPPSLVLLGDNATGWYKPWSEAAHRFGICLRLLISINGSTNASSTVQSTVNDHLSRMSVLSNQTVSMSQFISMNIASMILQIRAVRDFVNGSWQECLTKLETATQNESTLVFDTNTPTLLFAGSSELLALHLLLIHQHYQSDSSRALSTQYTLYGTQVSVSTFPSLALALYLKANQSTPNRAINLLGMARSYVQLGMYEEASRLFKLLINQMTINPNSTDPMFVKEANEYLAQHSSSDPLPYNTASLYSFSFYSIALAVFLLTVQ